MFGFLLQKGGDICGVVPGSKKEAKKLLMTFLYRLSFYPKVTLVLGIHFIL